MAGTLLWGFTPTTFACNTHFPSFPKEFSINLSHNFQQDQGPAADAEDQPSFFSGFQFGSPYAQAGEVSGGYSKVPVRWENAALNLGEAAFDYLSPPHIVSSLPIIKYTDSSSSDGPAEVVEPPHMSPDSSPDAFKGQDIIELTLDEIKETEATKQKKPKFDEISFDDIRFEEKIGEGSFGEVYRGFLWGQEIALKKLRIKGTTDNIKEFRKELKIMRTLRHPNIVEFLGACVEPNRMCIITEYLSNGSLEDVLERNAKLSKRIGIKRIVSLAKDIARGLNWLHHKGIIHRDLKTANILVDSNGKGKLADFGLSHIKTSSVCGTYGVVGTPCYMAPEVLQKIPYGEKADVFSFAVVLCEMIVGKYPYDNEPESTATFEKAIISGLRPDVPACIPSMQNLIVACWAEKPEDRPSMDQIMDALERMERDLNRTAMDARSLPLLEELPEEVQKLFEEERKRVLDERKRNHLLQSIIDQQKQMLSVVQSELFKTKAELDQERKSREVAEANGSAKDFAASRGNWGRSRPNVKDCKISTENRKPEKSGKNKKRN